MILLGALAAVSLSAGSSEVGESFADPDDSGRRALVIRVLEDEPGGASRAALELASPAVVPELLEVLVEGGIPASWGPTDRPRTSLDGQRLEAVRSALTRVPMAALREEATRRIDDDPRPRPREILIALIGERGDAADLSILGKLGTLEPTVEVPRSLESALVRALVAIAVRDPRAVPRMDGIFDSVPSGLRTAVVDSLVGMGSKEALLELGTLLDRDPALDADLLWAIVRLGDDLTPPHPEDLLGHVRSFLASSDAVRFQAAAHACGVLGDHEAIPSLVEALERKEENERVAVSRALRELTGLEQGDAPGAWSCWLESEQRWWEESAPLLLGELAAQEPERIVRAMARIAGHRLHSDVLARALVACLERSEEELVLMACEGLRQLGSPEALVGLIDRLDHPSGGVRRAVWCALRSITGKNLPAEPGLWRALL